MAKGRRVGAVAAGLMVILVAGALVGDQATGAAAASTTVRLQQNVAATATALVEMQRVIFATQTAIAAQPPAQSSKVVNATSTPLVRSTATASTLAARAAVGTQYTAVAEVLLDGASLRAMPGTASATIGSAAEGQRFPVVAQTGNCAWLQVMLEDGSLAWLSGASLYTRLDAGCEDIPSAAATDPAPIDLTPAAVSPGVIPPTSTAVVVKVTPRATETAAWPKATTGATAVAAVAPVATRTVTPTAVPTVAPTAAPTATRIAARSTPTQIPPTVAPTVPPTPAAVVQVDNTSEGDAEGPASFSVLSPQEGANADGPLNFSWAADAELGAGQVFELVFWRPGETPDMGKAANAAAATTSMQLNLGSVFAPGDYNWGLFVARPEPHYYRIRFIGQGGSIHVGGTNGGSNDRGNSGGGGSAPTKPNAGGK